MRRQRIWTMKEHLFVIENYGKLPFPEMGRRLGRSPESCMRHLYNSREGRKLQRLLAPALAAGDFPLALHNRLLDLYQADQSDGEVGKATGLHPARVGRWRRLHGLPEVGHFSPAYRDLKRKQLRDTCRAHGVASGGALVAQRQRVGVMLRGSLVALTVSEERVARFLRAAGVPLTVAAIASGTGYTHHPEGATWLRKVLTALKKRGVVRRAGWERTGPDHRNRLALYAYVPGHFANDRE